MQSGSWFWVNLQKPWNNVLVDIRLGNLKRIKSNIPLCAPAKPLPSWENVASKWKLNVEQHIKKVISRCKTKAEKGSGILNILAPFIYKFVLCIHLYFSNVEEKMDQHIKQVISRCKTKAEKNCSAIWNAHTCLFLHFLLYSSFFLESERKWL